MSKKKKPQILKEIDDNIAFRKKRKQEIDSVINLSNKSDERKKTMLSTKMTKGKKVRLLDEGAILYGDGDVRLFIKKGALKAYMNTLPEDYVGSINIGHMNFAGFPFLVGEWNKSDLSIVDIGDGRHALEVEMKLYEDSIFVQELVRRDYSVAVSVEIDYTIDWTNTDLLGYTVVEDLFMTDFAIVGDPANVSSADIKLSKGENEMGLFEKLFSKYGIKKTEELENETTEEVEEVEETEEEETVEEVETEEEEIETEEEAEETEEDEEEEVEEDEEETDDVAETLANIIVEKTNLEQLAVKMNADLEKVNKENAELKKENAKLKTEKSTIEKTLAKFSKKSVKTALKKKDAEKEELAEQDEDTQIYG